VEVRASQDELETTRSENPLFGVAMLKIALELKRPGAGPFERIVNQVMSRMSLDEGEFRAFLGTQGGLLKALYRPAPA
jgi:hypothetical protein